MNPSELANATIVELRKFAKDRGIVIGALRTKSDILDHIQNDDYYPDFVDKLTHLFFCSNKFHCFNDG